MESEVREALGFCFPTTIAISRAANEEEDPVVRVSACADILAASITQLVAERANCYDSEPEIIDSEFPSIQKEIHEKVVDICLRWQKRIQV